MRSSELDEWMNERIGKRSACIECPSYFASLFFFQSPNNR